MLLGWQVLTSLLLASKVIIIAAASPIGGEAASKKCINGTQTETLNFDDRRTGPRRKDMLTERYHGLYVNIGLAKGPRKWTGYSKPNVALAFSGSANWFAPGVFGGYGEMRLQSFDAACMSYGFHDRVEPQNCSILVSTSSTGVTQVSDSAYMYHYDIADLDAPRFKRFVIDGKQKGGQFNFEIVPGPVGIPITRDSSGLSLDNIVFSAKC